MSNLNAHFASPTDTNIYFTSLCSFHSAIPFFQLIFSFIFHFLEANKRKVSSRERLVPNVNI